VFIPAAYYNARESSDVIGHFAEQWCHMKPGRDNVLAVARAIDEFHENSRTMVVYIQCSAALAQKRVIERGREFEATGMKLRYMQELVNLHEKCFRSIEDDDRIVGAKSLGIAEVMTVTADDWATDNNEDVIDEKIAPLVDTIVQKCLSFIHLRR
jgi:hypothetical protein